MVPKTRVKRKRSKTLVFLILPMLIFIGLVGWLINELEPPHRKAKKVYQAPKSISPDDGLTFLPAVYGEQVEIEAR